MSFPPRPFRPYLSFFPLFLWCFSWVPAEEAPLQLSRVTSGTRHPLPPRPRLGNGEYCPLRIGRIPFGGGEPRGGHVSEWRQNGL